MCARTGFGGIVDTFVIFLGQTGTKVYTTVVCANDPDELSETGLSKATTTTDTTSYEVVKATSIKADSLLV